MFRKSYSTDTSRTKLIKIISVLVVMLDLQKAFDSINHDILLFKLEALGFKDDVINWISL